MTPDTCATLATVFPILILTVILEGKSVHPKLRSQRWYTYILSGTLVSGFGGLVFSVIGVQMKGILDPAPFVWILFGLSLVLVFVFLILVAASLEVEADSETSRAELLERLTQTRWGRTRLALGLTPPAS